MSVQLDALLSHGRLTSSEGCRRLFDSLPSLPAAQQLSTLTRLEAALSASPHNRNVCAGPAGLVNAALRQLPHFHDADCRAAAVRIVRLLGRHRFTVHNTRTFLAAIQREEAAARAARAEGGAAARAHSLELLRLLVEIVGGAPDPAEPSAFWDMAVGVMGATGFDLPAERVVGLAARGSFTLSLWLRLETLPANPTAVFALVDAAGVGLKLQLHRAAPALARAELVVTEPRQGSTAARMLGMRLSGGAGSARGTGMDASSTTFEFGPDAVVRVGCWHLLSLSCRRSTLLALGSSMLSGQGIARDEALLCVDGHRAIRAQGFRYPSFSTDRAASGHAAIGAAATPHSAAAALRGQLGAFVLLDVALPPAEAEAVFKIAKSGRALFEQPHVLAAWHPLLSDRSGLCVAVTTEGPWPATPRAETISVVEVVSARDSAGGMLNTLLPLLPLRRRQRQDGALVLSESLRLIAALLQSHARNQEEMLRSDGMLLLGQLLRSISAAHFTVDAVHALASLAETTRQCPPLCREFLDKVILRFDVWRRLEPAVQSSVLALVNALAASDEETAKAVNMTQRLLDAARKYFGVHSTKMREREALHAQCLSTAALLASDRLACDGALPLVAHALHFGIQLGDAEAEAQAASLSLLLRLVEAHGSTVLLPLHASLALHALVSLMTHTTSPRVAMLCARLVCAPIGHAASLPFSAQWHGWMESRGLAAIRKAAERLPADEELFLFLAGLLLNAPEESIDQIAEPRIVSPQILPALFSACARAPPAVQLRQLERFSLWIRCCPQNCVAFDMMAPYWQPHAARLLATATSISSSRGEGGDVEHERLAGTLCVELLCTLALESMSLALDPAASDERWRALGGILVLIQGCGSPDVAHRARRTFLRRLLASMVRKAKRLAADAVTSVPLLLQLCAVVRVHALQPPPPLPPVSVDLRVDRAGCVGVALSVRHEDSHWTLSPAARWDQIALSEGHEAVSEEIDLLLRLSEVLDPLTVRAMMDDFVDAAVHTREEATIDGRPRSSQHSVSFGGLGGKLIKGIGGLTLGASPPRSSPASSMGDGIGSAPFYSNSGSISGCSIFEYLLHLLLLLAHALPRGIGSQTIKASDSNGSCNSAEGAGKSSSPTGASCTWWQRSSAAADGGAQTENAAAMVKAVQQRLRELLWRDLEQGCTWAHLSSIQEGQTKPTDDSHWEARRYHVHSLIARLADPLRALALDMRDGGAPYWPSLAETLVPQLQGVLRTYRHFLARSLAPPTDVAGYGRLVIAISSLEGAELPLWLKPECDPFQFIHLHAQWAPLLDTPPLALATLNLREQQSTFALMAASASAEWASAAYRSWTDAVANEERQAASAASESARPFAILRHSEINRATSADAREAAAATTASQRWAEAQRSLQREQVAWEAPGENTSTQLWEHLECEDIWRRRPLLTPNPNGSDHSKASMVQQQSGGSASLPAQAGVGIRGEDTDHAALRRVASLARHTGLGGAVDDGGGALDESGEEGDEGADAGSHAPTHEAGLSQTTSASDTTLGEADNAAVQVAQLDEVAQDSSLEEAMLVQLPCELIWRGGMIAGTLCLSRASLQFEPDPSKQLSQGAVAADDGEANAESRLWPVQELRQLQRRRYLLMHTAIEIFVSQSTIFFNLHTVKGRDKMRRALKRVGVPERSWSNAKAALTEQWHRREISNFEYLMELNTLAGRSFADLNQYPVFPWILADYKSSKLDLNSPHSYRDLSKPVGALNPERLAQVIERYESMGDADMPRFHYGSHYSSAGATLFWLLRMEPYTSYAIDLQSGRFDHADRLFYSIEEAWNSCNTSLADVKELIPEFFYLPDFLVNRSRFQLGVRQDGQQVDNVKLPPWAATAEEFIVLHRRALESEHVSANLHLWIDLIFGAKQRLPAAEAAANVFFYLTYELDLEKIEDETERDALRSQVACFGQTPPQLFTSPHPPRRAALPFYRPLHWGPAGANALSCRPFVKVPLKLVTTAQQTGKALALSAISVVGEPDQRRVLCVDGDSTVHCLRWPPQAARVPQVASARRHCSTQLPRSDSSKSACIALLDASPLGGRGVFVLTGGHFDGALCISSESGRTVHVAMQHSRSISCVALSANGMLLLTGAADTTVVLWRLEATKNSTQPYPLHTLRGHVRELTAVALSYELSIAASGAADGCVLLHTTHNGSLVRNVVHPDKQPVGHLLVSAIHCRVVIGACTTDKLYVFSLSGVELTSLVLAGGVRCSILSPDGTLLIAGGVRGPVSAWRLDDGSEACRFEGAEAAVACGCILHDPARGSELLVGTQEGDILGFALDPGVLFNTPTRDVASWAKAGLN